MSLLGASIGQDLAADATIASLMGPDHAARIAPGAVRQGKAETAIVHQILNVEDLQTLPGVTLPVHDGNVQVKVYAKDQDLRDRLGTAVLRRLRSLRGRTIDDVEIRNVRVTFNGDTVEFPDDGSEGRDYLRLFRLSIWHRVLTEV